MALTEPCGPPRVPPPVSSLTGGTGASGDLPFDQARCRGPTLGRRLGSPMSETGFGPPARPRLCANPLVRRRRSPPLAQPRAPGATRHLSRSQRHAAPLSLRVRSERACAP